MQIGVISGAPWPVKILWLSHIVPFPPKGGVLQRSYHLLRETARAHRVYLLSFIQSSPLKSIFGDVESGLNAAREALSEFCAGVEFVPIPSESRRLGKARLLLRSVFTKHPYTINWLKSQEMSSALARVMKETGFDIVHFDTISLAPYLDQVLGPARVISHHNIESHMMARRASKEANPVNRLYLHQEAFKLRRYEKAICPCVDLNLTCSSLDTERLRAVASDVATTEIPNGVDLEYFRPAGRTERPNSLVFAGRLSAYPNRRAAVFIAERLWPLLKRELPEICIDIVGASPPDTVTRLSRHDSRFRVHGFVEDVRPYLERAQVYVCPISDGGGTKLKVLDALAMGRALVADPIACEGIDVVDGETVLFATSPEEYVRHVIGLLKDSVRRGQLGRAGRELITRQYSYSRIGKALSEAYRRCSSHRGHGRNRH